MLESRSVLKVQIETLSHDLARVQAKLNAKVIEPYLREKVQVRFFTTIRRQREELGKLAKKLGENANIDQCWEEYRKIRRDCVPILIECLAFLQGVVVRSVNLDEGICLLADEIVQELNLATAAISWPSISILGEREATHPVSGVIRIRFTESNIWNLPLIGHEFGHILYQHLSAQNADFKAMLKAEAEADRFESRFHQEFFCDFFATYALGPAFACASIFLNFDPGNAYRAEGIHPSFAARAYLIIAALKKIDEVQSPAVFRPYQGVINVITDFWESSVRALKQEGSFEGGERLKRLCDQFYEFLDIELRERDTNWPRVQQLAEALEKGVHPAEPLGPDDRLMDVLNAAWLRRLSAWDQDLGSVNQLRDSTFDFCREVIEKRRAAQMAPLPGQLRGGRKGGRG